MITPDPFVRVRAALARSTGESSDFDLNPGARPSDVLGLRPAAVLIALWSQPSGVQVILTKRSSRLQHHPGQIAFPGGKVDASDASIEAAALREAHEEIGLAPENVKILGQLPIHETVTGFVVTPILGYVRADFTPTPEAGEVDEVFVVPLAHLTEPANFRIERRRWRGEWRQYYAVPWGPYYTWGATARILRGLAERMQT